MLRLKNIKNCGHIVSHLVVLLDKLRDLQSCPDGLSENLPYVRYLCLGATKEINANIKGEVSWGF